MDQADRDAQQIACNTASSMHSDTCNRKSRPVGELFNSSAALCICWVAEQAREDIRREYGE